MKNRDAHAPRIVYCGGTRLGTRDRNRPCLLVASSRCRRLRLRACRHQRRLQLGSCGSKGSLRFSTCSSDRSLSRRLRVFYRSLRGLGGAL